MLESGGDECVLALRCADREAARRVRAVLAANLAPTVVVSEVETVVLRDRGVTADELWGRVQDHVGEEIVRRVEPPQS